MRAPNFKSTDVARLYDEIKPWCHPEHPFLAPKAPAASLTPAIDFTPQIATWLEEGKKDAITELWGYLSYQKNSSRTALRRALDCQLPATIQLSKFARYELHAIYILATRAALCSKIQDIADVSSLLAATTIASRQLVLLPDGRSGDTVRMTKAMLRAAVYPVEMPKLVQAEIREDTFPGSVHGKEKGARLSMDKALSPLGVAENAADKLKSIPPIARYVVYDYFYGSQGTGTLRFDLFYEQQAYGCGGEENKQYVDWLGFFSEIGDDVDVPGAVTKEILRDALAQRGITCKQSVTRKELIEQARGVKGLLSSVILPAHPQKRDILYGWKQALRDWAFRVRCVEPVAKAVLKLMGAKGLT
jgi:hypothetical protein